ncbi:HU family DNA-binding protein [Sphingobium sp. BS19]|uniref:HU family DNA-binding protein n=1 Tax=Sphingobium sp. BS19 TaxID=3018973 RepID=UPI0028527BF4|nr:HU family DNA-binding protein [Sphingobium sp. BS19]
MSATHGCMRTLRHSPPILAWRGKRSRSRSTRSKIFGRWAVCRISREDPMTGNELVEAVAAQQNATKAEVKRIIDAALGVIANAAARGEEVSIAGFGKFKVKQSAAREGKNPRTGDPITIPASRKVGFQPAKALKDKVNG